MKNLLFLTIAILTFLCPILSQNSPQIKNLREHIISQTPNEIKATNTERDLLRFADRSAIYINSIFERGLILQDQYKYEDYINQVLKRVMPDELKADTMIRAYLMYGNSFNAAMTAAGVAFIDSGVFNQVEDESVLAGILAHELAHYYKHHSLDGFIKNNNGEFRPHLLFKSKASERFSIKNENEADKYAMKWMKESGYNLKGLVDAFKIMKNTEQNIIGRSRQYNQYNATTHPLSDERLANLVNFQKENSIRPGKNFLISDKIFLEISALSKSICLEKSLADFSFDKCIEQAFKFHIQEPSNKENIYFLLEAIRRKCYMNSDGWGKNFITSDYYLDKYKDGWKIQRTDHIFEEFPYQILNIPEGKMDDFPGKFYWNGEIKFKTYEEAFIYFNRVAEKLGMVENQLINALSYAGSPDLLNEYLTQYLSNPEIENRAFAEALLNDEVYTKLPNKTLTVFSDFTFMVKQGEEEITLRAEEFSSTENSLDSILTRSKEEFSNRKFIMFEDYKDESIDTYRFLQQLEYISLLPSLSRDDIQLYILNPQLYNFFYNHKINEIEFVNFRFTEVQKKSDKETDYEKIMILTHSDLLHKEKATRFAAGFISSIRVKEDAAMKIRHYVRDPDIKFKNPAYDEVVNALLAAFKDKDARAKRIDYYIQKEEEED